MKILVVSGIWPPDVGGPATHAPELASWLAARGHHVEALTTALATPAGAGYRVHWVSRRLPPGARHAAVAAAVARAARRADVVYATSMVGRTAAGAALARRPFVAKLTSDPAFERSRRRGLVDGETVAFQGGGGGLGAGVLRAVRDRSVRQARFVICPSAYIAELAARWRGSGDGVVVLPNPAPSPAEAAAVDFPGERPHIAFVGRLTAAKNLGVAIDAVRGLDAGTLVVVGDGEERSRLEKDAGERVRFLGARSRADALGFLAAADVAVLPSAWENFPHAAVEALALGTPLVATRVGGVPEIVVDGENGLLVEPNDAAAFAAALERVLGDDALRARLADAAAPSVGRFAIDTVYGEIERLLAEAAA
ncbi:MAG TPA: glycosyltransferase family 4 protein [Gaiellaceae bacterium]|nr:glycosyltransferase family 4 protein [Gaiellaceae bacterium]